MPAAPEILHNSQVQPYLDLHAQTRAALPGEHVKWHADWRKGCLQRFADNGFPMPRDEGWRYTPLRPVLGKQFTSIQANGNGAAWSASGIDAAACTITFVDGMLKGSTEGLLPGIRIEPIAAVLNQDPDYLRPYLGRSTEDSAHAFSLMNNALYRDGVLIEIGQGICSEATVELLFISRTDTALIMPRIVVISRAESTMQIVERHISEGASHTLTCGVNEIYLERDARLNYHLIESSSDGAYQIMGNWAYLSRNSQLNYHTTTVGGALVRNDLQIDLQEPGAGCNLLGAYCLSGRQHVDNFTTVIHSAPHCNSNEHYKGVLDQRSRAVFQGRVRVAPDAQKSDAQQANNTLLLSSDAEIDAKPQLEIYADDVKCSHGATVGNLDEQAMFYLKARGIDRDRARSMLIRAFIDEILDTAKVDMVQQHVKALVDSKMSKNLSAQSSGQSS